ncbi:MAG: hypothetical protein F6K62_11760 [Sphaerospermopsis sp. SIO1G2]|nr:hypothetical protein [Sphaerospermopsis sp. SIO1G2]
MDNKTINDGSENNSEVRKFEQISKIRSSKIFGINVKNKKLTTESEKNYS